MRFEEIISGELIRKFIGGDVVCLSKTAYEKLNILYYYTREDDLIVNPWPRGITIDCVNLARKLQFYRTRLN